MNTQQIMYYGKLNLRTHVQSSCGSSPASHHRPNSTHLRGEEIYAILIKQLNKKYIKIYNTASQRTVSLEFKGRPAQLFL